MNQPTENTTTKGALPSTGDTGGIRGGNADERMDADNSTIGRGADGDTQAREALRVGLGERSGQAGRESGDAGLGADEATPPEL